MLLTAAEDTLFGQSARYRRFVTNMTLQHETRFDSQVAPGTNRWFRPGGEYEKGGSADEAGASCMTQGGGDEKMWTFLAKTVYPVSD